MVWDGGNGYFCDWVDWVELCLVGEMVELKFMEFVWKVVSVDWG